MLSSQKARMELEMDWEEDSSQDDGVVMDLSNIPIVILENILSHLTDPVSQRRLEQVWYRLVTNEVAY